MLFLPPSSILRACVLCARHSCRCLCISGAATRSYRPRVQQVCLVIRAVQFVVAVFKMSGGLLYSLSDSNYPPKFPVNCPIAVNDTFQDSNPRPLGTSPFMVPCEVRVMVRIPQPNPRRPPTHSIDARAQRSPFKPPFEALQSVQSRLAGKMF